MASRNRERWRAWAAVGYLLSGGQSRARPQSIGTPPKYHAVMQPGWTPLPELDIVRHQSIAAPMIGPWWVLAQFGSQAFLAGFELGARNGLALRRYPCADTGPQRSAVVVIVRLFRRHLFDGPFHAHLAFQRLP